MWSWDEGVVVKNIHDYTCLQVEMHIRHVATLIYKAPACQDEMAPNLFRRFSSTALKDIICLDIRYTYTTQFALVAATADNGEDGVLGLFDRFGI
jgi:hypothetical protein